MIPTRHACPMERHDGSGPEPATVSGAFRDIVTGEEHDAIFCPTCARILETLGVFLPDAP